MAFNTGSFKKYCDDKGIKLMPVPSKLHNEKSVERKPGNIMSMFLKLQDAQPDTNSKVLAIQAVTISNPLY